MYLIVNKYFILLVAAEYHIYLFSKNTFFLNDYYPKYYILHKNPIKNRG